jgi:hypothetical protein
MGTPERDALWPRQRPTSRLWALVHDAVVTGDGFTLSQAETRRCQVEAASFVGRAARVPQVAVTSGIQRAVTVTPTRPLR